MKKCVVIILLAVLLTGCDIEADSSYYNPNVTTKRVKFDLIEDPSTGILYIDNEVKLYHVYTPYYSENGKLCRLNDGKIVEVTENGGE